MCSLDYLDRLQKKLLKSTTEDIALYLWGRSEDRSRKRKFTLIDDLLIRELNERNKDLHLRSLADLHAAHTGKVNPSESVVISKVTRKKNQLSEPPRLPYSEVGSYEDYGTFSGAPHDQRGRDILQ